MYRTKIAIIVILIVSFSISVVSFCESQNENRVFKNKNDDYQIALNSLSSNPSTTIEIAERLLMDDKNNPTITELIALANKNKNNYKMSEEYFRKTINNRPALLNNFGFVMNYGVVLYKTGNFTHSINYINHAKTLPHDKKFNKTVDDFLDRIQREGKLNNDK